jgi:hypothetical protein
VDVPALELGRPREEAVPGEASVRVALLDVGRVRVPRVEVGEPAVLECEVAEPEVQSVANEQFALVAEALAVLLGAALVDVRQFLAEALLALRGTEVVVERILPLRRVGAGDDFLPASDHLHRVVEMLRERGRDGVGFLRRGTLPDADLHGRLCTGERKRSCPPTFFGA